MCTSTTSPDRPHRVYGLLVKQAGSRRRAAELEELGIDGLDEEDDLHAQLDAQ
jgi:hypothetical protein